MEMMEKSDGKLYEFTTDIFHITTGWYSIKAKDSLSIVLGG